MKIVLIGPVYPYRGGIAHYTTLMAKAFGDRGHKVKVISFKRQFPKWLYPGSTDRDPSQQPITVDASYILDPLYPWTWAKAVDQIKKEAPEMVLIQWWTTFWSFAYTEIAKSLKASHIRLGFLIHNVIPHEPRLWDRYLAKKTLRHGDFFLVQSSGQEEILRELLPKAKIELIEHPVYDMFASQKIDKKSARKMLGLPDGLPLILFFGIIRPYKGLSILLDAIGQLTAEGINAGLYIAGEFWEDVQKYQRQIEHLGLKDKVWIDNRYIPNEEVPVIFSAADVFVAPYVSGTQSGAVKMAMGFGMPVVVTQSILEDAMLPWIDCGIFACPPGDAPLLEKAIERAICFDQSDKLKEHSGESWQAFIRKMEQLVFDR